MAHFTCVNATVEELRADAGRDARARDRQRAGAARRPARGARTRWTKTEGGLEYSRELVELIAAEYDFAIGAACFPETHIHAVDAESDLRYLKEKVDAGARFLITQLFFENELYYDFVAPGARDRHRRCRSCRGSCRSPTSARSRASRSCAAPSCRAPLVEQLELRADEPEAVAEFGVAYATLQCADLLGEGRAGHPLLHAEPLARRRARSSARCGSCARGSARAPPRRPERAQPGPSSRPRIASVPCVLSAISRPAASVALSAPSS